MILQYENAINVFTDASMVKTKDCTLVCPGEVVVFNGGILHFNADIFSDATIAYGEAYALAKGIEFGLELNKTIFKSTKNINIFSDSEISVSGCTSWLNNWYKKGKDEKILMTGTSKKEVANMELFLGVIHTVISNNMNVSIYNILGHCREHNVQSMDEFRKYFLKANKMPVDIDIPIQYLQQMCKFNNYVDQMSRDCVRTITFGKEFDKEFFKKKKIPGIYWYPNQDQIQAYNQLVNQ